MTIDVSFIMQMTEAGEQAMEAADEKMRRASEPLRIVEQYADGLFDVAMVGSGDKRYRVVRLGTFVHCQCPDWKHSKMPCKHVAFAAPAVCRRCFTEPVAIKGSKCRKCQRNIEKEEMDNAPLLKPALPQRPTERVGGIRI